MSVNDLNSAGQLYFAKGDWGGKREFELTTVADI